MDPNILETPTPLMPTAKISFFDQLKKHLQKPLFIIPIVVILAVFVALVFYFWKQQEENLTSTITNVPQEKEATLSAHFFSFKQNQAIAKAGEELIYKADLDYNLDTYFPNIATDSAKSDDAINSSLNKLIEDSIILQAAQKEGVIKLPSEVFNNPNKGAKEITQRNILLNTVRKEIEDKLIDKVSGEAVSIWFYNASYPPPKMGIEKAKAIAKEKIEVIYADLKSGKISFEQAGQRIAQDTSLQEIDPSYKGNSYYSFKDRAKPQPIFIDPKANQMAWSLKADEMSKILTINDFGLTDTAVKPYDAMFKIIQINKKSGNGFEDFSKWLASQKSKYEIIKY